MLFKTRYSQEMLERLKALIHEETVLKKITGFISDEKWIYFEPEANHKIRYKEMKALFSVKMKLVKGEGCKRHTGLHFSEKVIYELKTRGYTLSK